MENERKHLHMPIDAHEDDRLIKACRMIEVGHSVAMINVITGLAVDEIVDIRREMVNG